MRILIPRIEEGSMLSMLNSVDSYTDQQFTRLSPGDSPAAGMTRRPDIDALKMALAPAESRAAKAEQGLLWPSPRHATPRRS